MARFLIELLHGEEDAIEVIEKQMFEEQLTPEQRNSLLDLQTQYEDVCESLRKLIRSASNRHGPLANRRRRYRGPAPHWAKPGEPALDVGARVIPAGSTLVYEITRVSGDGTQVDLCLRGTNLERFRVPVTSLKFVM
jgi:hypothetical protein